jgi:arylformamidase
MLIQIKFPGDTQTYSVDLSQPLDLSIRMSSGFDNPNCFWAPPVAFEPVRAGNFVGSTAEGGVVNFFDVRFNPHGNGTHTECVGHISKERFLLTDCLKQSHFKAKILSIYPQKMEDGDRVILLESIKDFLSKGESTALIIRTLPNDETKQNRTYSGANPPYIHHEAIQYIVDCGVEHLLVDLPSVDRAEDGGQLLAHRAFWQYPTATRKHATISELLFIPDQVKDGYYLLNLQTASFDLDVSPSKPVVFGLVAS